MALIMSIIGVALAGDAGILKQTHTYKTVGDCDIEADVYRLPGNEIRPALVWIHGGALIFGDREMIEHDVLKNYHLIGQVQASAGHFFCRNMTKCKRPRATLAD